MLKSTAWFQINILIEIASNINYMWIESKNKPLPALNKNRITNPPKWRHSFIGN